VLFPYELLRTHCLDPALLKNLFCPAQPERACTKGFRRARKRTTSVLVKNFSTVVAKNVYFDLL
jgi:hypothetical protein